MSDPVSVILNSGPVVPNDHHNENHKSIKKKRKVVSKNENGITLYDMTVFEPYTVDNTKRWIREWCKKWAFQEEKGELKGKLHLQCKLDLTKKKRFSEFLRIVRTEFENVKLSPSHDRKMNYVIKADSRVAGPWKDSDPGEEEDPISVCGDLECWDQIEKTAYPWQQSILANIKLKDRTNINTIVDAKGLNGKSTLATYCLTKKLAMVVPPFNDMTKMTGFIHSMPQSGAYFLDVPRALNKKRKNCDDFWAGVEVLKTGRIPEWRYKGKWKVFNPPVIWIFSNNEPDVSITKERMKVWYINKEGTLYNPKENTIMNTQGKIIKVNNVESKKQPSVVNKKPFRVIKKEEEAPKKNSVKVNPKVVVAAIPVVVKKKKETISTPNHGPVHDIVQNIPRDRSPVRQK